VVDTIATPKELSSHHMLTMKQTIRQTSFSKQQELVRLPVAPLSDECRPGLALLIESYTERMEATVNSWAASILAQDVAVGRLGGVGWGVALGFGGENWC
jgi:hypothetical protein